MTSFAKRKAAPAIRVIQAANPPAPYLSATEARRLKSHPQVKTTCNVVYYVPN